MVSDASTLLEGMLLCRGFEQRCVDVVEARAVGDLVVHTSIGQEASAVATATHRGAADLMFSTHRGIAHCIAWGADLEKLAAEVLGRRGGYAGGLAGHMHVVDLACGIAGTNGIVGGGLPAAVGAALALTRRGEPGCVVAYFGDGAANTGACHEALNLAAVWGAPVVFVCENNELAEMTWSAALTAGSVAGRAAALGLEVRVAEGGDVLEVTGSAGELMGRARAGGGPALLECRSFRAGGHWVGDPEHYRDERHKASFPERDAIRRLIDRGLLDRAAEAQVRERVEQRLEAVFGAVLAMPPPDPADLHRPHLAP